MRKKREKMLVIVGNGFDLAHGYHTTYESFIENTDDESLERFKKICGERDIKTWYSFEQSINSLTCKIYMESFAEEVDWFDNRNKAKIIEKDYSHIHRLFISYLKNESDQRKFVSIDSVKKYFTRHTKTICFNYTNTVKNYAKNVFYVHGSIDEDDIILGYDHRQEPCLGMWVDIQWNKSLCRELLAFKRKLTKIFFLSQKAYDRLVEGMKEYLVCENAGIDPDTKPASYIQYYRLYRRFIEKYRTNQDVPPIDYNSIEEIVIMGHGIEADREYLTKILERCKGLKKVIIFKYDGESDEIYNVKKDFFAPYCKDVCTDKY